MKTALFLLLATAAVAADAPLLKDDFSAPKLESRRASRGEWKFADNIATCTQDDEPDLKLKPGEWTNVSVELRGGKATLKVGDFTKTYEHASFARAKTNLSVGFAFGTVSVKDVVVEK